ncbi:MAG: apolipoprotein N-acyltransferase, partial [Armatimonadetes bacterium]|nr:apolipoprotein N-acyltransferase [Armatimonadota bacterium]
ADIGGLAWVAAALFFFAMGQAPSAAWGAAAGAVYGAAFFGPLLWYISAFGLIPWALVVVLEAIFYAAAGCLSAYLNRMARVGWRIGGLAAIWVLIEYLRAHRGALSLSLGSSYYSQWSLPPILQLASIGGSLLISFFIGLLGAALATAAAAWLPGNWLRPPGWGPRQARDAARALLAAYALFFVAYFWGASVYRAGSKAIASMPETAGFDVGFVQAAEQRHHVITQEEAVRSTEAYFYLTELLPAGLDLVVWPETAVPLVLEEAEDYRARIARMAREKGSFMLVGTNERAPGGRLYNTLLLVSPNGAVIDRYRKVHLIIFGEYVPGRDRWKFLHRFPIRPYDYAPGDGFKVLEASRMKFGVLICFEALFPEYTRWLCQHGAEFIVIATSDAWAAKTYEVAQHSRTAIFRAVEARRYVVRVGTHGESMVITPVGECLSVIPIGESGTQRERIFPIKSLSPYHRVGDWPLLCLCLILWAGACYHTLASGRE